MRRFAPPRFVVVTMVLVLGAGTIVAIGLRVSNPGGGRAGVGGRQPDPVPTTAAAPEDPAASELGPTLELILARTPDACATAGAGNRLLYEANPDRALAPASLTKILTAVAALDVLGPETRFRTRVLGRLDADGVVRGDLSLVGGGDPVLGTDAWAGRGGAEGRLHTSLDTLADSVASTGVRRVTGRILADESRFDRQRTVESWPRRLVLDGEAGPLSALIANDGFEVWGHPGEPFRDPALGTAGLFRTLLSARGVVVEGGPGSGPAPVDPELAAIASAPVGELVAEFLRESDNETAELLVKEVGLRRRGEGSTAAGVRAVRDALAARGIGDTGNVIADGSGLSTDARLTCRLLTDVLASAEAVLADRLAVAGRTGTLRSRLRDTPAAGRLRAKTGSLDGVSGLAGYAETVHGQRIAFAYVANGVDAGTTRSVQDQFAVALVTAGA